ncbi:hypothetical protein [Pseudomonas soli]|uniref:hypothetical protein n=1 Tax=Pseudomonas soli TaxID=1306993 RepID=UPI0028B209D7|nr:hypothetical protein [Pseudomonas soli]
MGYSLVNTDEPRLRLDEIELDVPAGAPEHMDFDGWHGMVWAAAVVIALQARMTSMTSPALTAPRANSFFTSISPRAACRYLPDSSAAITALLAALKPFGMTPPWHYENHRTFF